MELLRTVDELRRRLESERAAGRTVGMVGTSGGMHEGHQALIGRAAAENDLACLYWAGAATDIPSWHTGSLTMYERDADHDWRLAEEAGCQILFAPPGEILFPEAPATRVSLPSFSNDFPQLEDPAHLDLVALVMCKVWNWFGPCRSYAGEKDWQQLVLFMRLARDLDFPVEVVGCEIVRDEDGVAVSSRNSKLTPEQRAVAPVLHRALGASRDVVQAGTTDASAAEQAFAEQIGDRAEIVYFAAVHGPTMTPLTELEGKVRFLASIQLGEVRLLDNIGVDLPAG